MKTTLYFLSVILCINATAQCDGNRYLNFLFTETESTTDVQYGENINYQGLNETLYMDIYEPAGDLEDGRPLLVMCHGGYFLSGDKAGPDMLPLCTDLAKMGYVVASINYRKGIPFGTSLEVPYGQAVVRAVQDLRAAIRWFRKNAETDGNTYRVDTNKIFVGGASAGAFMALHLAYMDESEIPSWLDMTISGLEGGLEGESGNPGYSSDVAGILPVSGALGDSDWIDNGDTTPACMFHGDADATVTIDSATFVLFGLINVTTIEGSNYIADRMEDVGIDYCYHVTPGGGHVPYLGDAVEYDYTLSLMSGFMHGMVCNEDFDCSYHEILSGTREIIEKKSGSVYPNPAKDIFFLNGADSRTRSILFTLDGRKVHEIVGAQFNAAHLAEGIYLIETDRSTGAPTRERIIIAH